MKTPYWPLLVISVLLFFAGCQRTDPHLERGKEWLDLGKFDRAQTEFEESLRINPKDIAPRILLGRSFLAQNQIAEAQQWCDDARNISSSDSGIETLQNDILAALAEMLRSPDQGVQLAALQLLNQYDPQRFESELSTLVPSPNPQIAEQGEQKIRSYNPTKANNLLKQQLTSNDRSIQIRSANRLWVITRDSEAQAILIQNHAETWRQASDRQTLQAAALALQDLGYLQTREILFECFSEPGLATSDRIELAVAAIEQNSDDSSRAYLAKALEIYKPEGGFFTQNPRGFLLEAIERFKVGEATAKLKLMVSENINSSWVGDYLHTLSIIDDPAWNEVQYYYRKGGWTEWDKILIDIKGVKENNRNIGSGENPFDGTSNPQKVEQFLNLLGDRSPLSLFSGVKGLGFAGESSVSVISPTKVDLNVQLAEKDVIKKEVVFHLLATGHTNRAWFIDDITISDIK